MIWIAIEANSRRTKIVVHADGIGISPADLPFVFDRFYQADPSRALVGGNGLGLAIAKWIADTHLAELSATSESGKGTIFTVVFASNPEFEIDSFRMNSFREGQMPRPAIGYYV